MMRWIVRSSLHFRFIVVALAVGMVAFGATRVSNMPVDVFPEFAPPFVEVQTEGLGMSTEEVETLITIPMEQALNSTPGLDTMRSTTVPGLSAITLIFDRGTDPLEARQLVNERVATAIPSLPASAGIPWTLQPLSATSRAMKIGLTCDHCDLTDLSMIAYWTMRWRLMAVPGVANVVIWGDRWKQLQFQMDPAKLEAHNMTIDGAMSVASDALDFGLLKYTDAAKNRVGGYIETPNQRLGIHHVLPVFTPQQLASVTVSGRQNADGSPLELGDLGTMVWGHQPLFGDAVINDHQGLLMVVEKFPWANTLDVTRGVDQALDQMRPGLPGIHMDNHIFRPAEFIEISISNLTDALLLGTLLVIRSPSPHTSRATHPTRLPPPRQSADLLRRLRRGARSCGAQVHARRVRSLGREAHFDLAPCSGSGSTWKSPLSCQVQTMRFGGSHASTLPQSHSLPSTPIS